MTPTPNPLETPSGLGFYTPMDIAPGEFSKEPLETPSDDITLCTSCNCMTHTIDGKCGKCDAAKVETPSEPTYTLKQLSILIRYALDLSLLVKMTLPQHEEHVKETVAVIERLIAEEVRRARIDKVTKLQIAYSIHRYYAKSSIIPNIQAHAKEQAKKVERELASLQEDIHVK